MTAQTEQQKNIELLEYCGWTKIRKSGIYIHNIAQYVGIPPNHEFSTIELPDLYNDLNAQAEIIYPELIKRKVKFGIECLPELEDKSILYKAYIVSQRHCKFGDKPAPTFAEAALKYFRSK